MRFVTGIEAIYPYRGFDSGGSLKEAILKAKPSLIVPCDDGVVWQLHELHARFPELQPLIERSIGAKDAYPQIRSRAALLRAASELGIRVPLTETVNSEADLSPWVVDAPALLKLDGTCGGAGVAIVRSKEEAAAAFRRLSRPIGAGTAWKRLVINHDPLALWSWRRQEAPSVTIQQYIAGRPANTMFAAWEGELLGIVTVEVITAQGETGAATVVRLVRNEEIEQAARLLTKRFNLSGFHGLDFVIDGATGAAYLIELNPRCTQLGHLRLAGQGDLAGAMSARLKSQAPPEPEDCIEGDTVAFFPQTFNWNPKSVYMRRGYHDVPWEEPALFRELLRHSWPERQWLTRIYHHFRPVRRQEEVKFQTGPGA
jgi:hypothetical protein